MGTPSNSYGAERLTVDNTYYGHVKNLDGPSGVNIYSTGERGGRMMWTNCRVNDVDTTNNVRAGL